MASQGRLPASTLCPVSRLAEIQILKCEGDVDTKVCGKDKGIAQSVEERHFVKQCASQKSSIQSDRLGAYGEVELPCSRSSPSPKSSFALRWKANQCLPKQVHHDEHNREGNYRGCEVHDCHFVGRLSHGSRPVGWWRYWTWWMYWKRPWEWRGSTFKTHLGDLVWKTYGRQIAD